MRVQQMQDARAQVMRQQANLVQQQQQAQAQAQAAQQQQQVQQPGQPQMRPPPQGSMQGQPIPNGQPRMGPNGQPMPNMAPSQQQLLTAVAAANAARQGVPGPSANGTLGHAVRPLPGQTPQQPPNPQMQQQMQMLQAQQIAARQAAQVQQNQNRAQASGETPRSNHSASPYQHTGVELPNGEMGVMQGSPAMAHMNAGPHSSPSSGTNMVRPLPSAHLRVASGGSPQMGAPVPPPQQAQGGGQGGISQVMMQQIAAQLQAAGQQPTPEAIRMIQAQVMRNVRVSNDA